MLMCKVSYRSQDEPLDEADTAAAFTVLAEARSEHVVLYNCTKDALCSRYHKHLQIFRKLEMLSEGGGFRFFPDRGVRRLKCLTSIFFIGVRDLQQLSSAIQSQVRHERT